MQWIILIAGAYLLGSVPFGLLLGFTRGVDIRTVGSGNIGATNALRTLGKPLGITCFALDVAKGAAPVLVAGFVTGVVHDHPVDPARAWLWLATGAGAIVGHMFPVYLRFKGGKGVATGFGALLGIWPHLTFPALAGLVVWVAILKTTRYVSVASCASALAIPLAAALTQLAGARPFAWPFVITAAALGALVIYRHRANLARLRAGTEPRIGRRDA